MTVWSITFFIGNTMASAWMGNGLPPPIPFGTFMACNNYGVIVSAGRPEVWFTCEPRTTINELKRDPGQ